VFGYLTLGVNFTNRFRIDLNFDGEIFMSNLCAKFAKRCLPFAQFMRRKIKASYPVHAKKPREYVDVLDILHEAYKLSDPKSPKRLIASLHF